MRIIQVNKFHYLRGGAEKYFLEISQALTLAGHEVAMFSMHHPLNWTGEWNKYFISRISFNEPGLKQILAAPGRIIYSLEAKRKFTKLIKDFKPDIIHIHNIYHQISPSILDVAKKYKIPVVMHVHDYKLICPNYKLYTEDKICYRCLGKRYHEAIFHKCLKDSYGFSSLVALEMFIHHKILKIYEKSVATYIAPSRFMNEVLIDFKYLSSNCEILYNFVEPKLLETPINYKTEDYLLYFGRLAEEKGVLTLLEAYDQVKDKNLKLKIVGAGPDKFKMQKEVWAFNFGKRVEFLGSKYGDELNDIISKAKAVIMPSVWLENMPFALLESLALGKIVIASEIGGIPEIVEDGVNGFLFKSGDASDLAKKINELNKFNLTEMATQARASVAKYVMDNHVLKLIDIYKKILKK
jgi:glycosyltransferase involved in cell wall biosynthesis